MTELSDWLDSREYIGPAKNQRSYRAMGGSGGKPGTDRAGPVATFPLSPAGIPRYSPPVALSTLQLGGLIYGETQWHARSLI